MEIEGAGYDLLTEAWIPVLRDGAETSVSLRDAVLDAHQIDGLSQANPFEHAGLLRLLSALVLCAYDSPSTQEWAQRYRTGRFDPEILETYLRPRADRFDLYDSEHPFMQVTGITALPKSMAAMLPEVATGNTPPIFSPDHDKASRTLSASQSARALVGGMAICVTNIGRARKEDPDLKAADPEAKANFSGRASAIGFLAPIGATLFETLMLNHPIDVTVGTPVWDRTDVPTVRASRPSTGVADLLTWTPRRAQLLPDDQGNCSAVIWVGGDQLAALDPRHEIHTAWSFKDNAVYPRQFSKKEIGWSAMPALLATSLTNGMQTSALIEQITEKITVLDNPPIGADHPIGIVNLSMSQGQMNALFDDARVDTYVVPLAALESGADEMRADLTDLVTAVEDVRYQVYKSTYWFVRNSGRFGQKDAIPGGRAETVTLDFVGRVDVLVRRFLSGFAADPNRFDEGYVALGKTIRQAAIDVFQQVVLEDTRGYFDSDALAERAKLFAVLNKRLPIQREDVPA